MRGFPNGSLVKNLLADAGDAGDRGQEDPLEEEMATHSSVLAWEILWTEEPGRPQSTGSQRVGHDQSDPVCIDTRFANGSSAPLRVECEGGTTALVVGTLVVPSLQTHRLPLPQELWPYQSLFF